MTGESRGSSKVLKRVPHGHPKSIGQGNPNAEQDPSDEALDEILDFVCAFAPEFNPLVMFPCTVFL